METVEGSEVLRVDIREVILPDGRQLPRALGIAGSSPDGGHDDSRADAMFYHPRHLQFISIEKLSSIDLLVHLENDHSERKDSLEKSRQRSMVSSKDDEVQISKFTITMLIHITNLTFVP